MKGSGVPVNTEEETARLKEAIEGSKWDRAKQLFAGLRPADQVDALRSIGNEDAGRLLAHMSASEIASVFDRVRDDDASKLAGSLDPVALSHMLDEADPRAAAHLLRELPLERSSDVLSRMEERETVEALLRQRAHTAGAHMTPEFVSLAPTMTVDEAIATVRQRRPPRDTVDMLYVVDERQRPLGQVSLRALLLAEPVVKIKDIMSRNVTCVRFDDDERECARLLSHYHLSMLPVVDGEGRLVGVIPPTESLEVADGQATADMYHMIGLSSAERVFAPFSDSVRRRLPWLSINLGTAVLAGLVVSLFESTIAAAVALAAFLPVIAGQGANAGSQTLTIIVRSLALGEVTLQNVRRAILKESLLAVANGAVIGLLAGIVACVWMGDVWFGVVLAVSMFLTMIVAGVSGALSPVVLKALGIDPALASTVVVTTITDVAGFFFLLGVATLMLGYIT